MRFNKRKILVKTYMLIVCGIKFEICNSGFKKKIHGELFVSNSVSNTERLHGNVLKYPISEDKHGL